MSRDRYPNTFYRRSTPVLTLRDELAFSRVLREFCPDVFILADDTRSPLTERQVIPTIPHSREAQVITALPSPGQEEIWAINRERGHVHIHPTCWFHLYRSWWEWPMPEKKWAFDPPLLGWARWVGSFPRDNETMKQFVMRVMRLINKVTWKRTGYGLDACLWSQAGKDERHGLGAGHVFPMDETVTLNKYYDDSLWDDSLPPDASLPERQS